MVGKMADVIEANANELARLLTSEQGKPLADATGEVMGMAGFFRYLSSLDLPMKVIEDSGPSIGLSLAFVATRLGGARG